MYESLIRTLRYCWTDSNMIAAAANAIESLEKENASLREQLAQATAERDAAIKDLSVSAHCRTCSKDCGVMEALSKRSNGTCPEYEWRGQKEYE